MEYQLILTWKDQSCKTECAPSIDAALRATEIYIQDPNLETISIFSWKTHTSILKIDLKAESRN